MHLDPKFPLLVFAIFLHLIKSGCLFETTLNTHKELRRWKFHGNYTYANSSSEIKLLVPQVLLQATPTTSLGESGVTVLEEFEREGVWLIKHESDGSNKWNMSYSMSHLLIAQAWVTFLAHPNVEVIFKSSGDQVVGRFWSDGKSWCDAIFNMGLRNTFTAEISTPEVGDYALIDKVVLGVMSNITTSKKRGINNPCLTTPLTTTNASMIDIQTDHDNELRRRGPTTERVTEHNNTEVTTTTTLASSPLKQASATSSRRTYQERGGAKCDCVCTCVKPNSTLTTTTTPLPIII